MQISSWFLAIRPKTLAAAFAPIIVGTATAFSDARLQEGKINFLYSFLALFSTMFIQIGTNLFNDVLDHKKGADTETRLGPKRVTQSGLLNHNQVLFGGFFCFFIAALFGIPLVWQGGLPILIVGIISLLCGYIYTGGPYPLAYKGLGEVFVVLFFGFVAVCGMQYVLLKDVSINSLVAAAQIGFLAAVLIAINNLRDHEGDKKVNKLTLAARFGKKFARIEIIVFFVIAYALNFYWIKSGYLLAGLLPFVTLPLAIKVSHGILKKEPSTLFNKFLGMAAGVELLFGILFSIGLIF